MDPRIIEDVRKRLHDRVICGDSFIGWGRVRMVVLYRHELHVLWETQNFIDGWGKIRKVHIHQFCRYYYSIEVRVINIHSEYGEQIRDFLR